MHILIVEDDPIISQQLKQALEGWAFEATEVTRFDQVLETFQEVMPQLVLMDIVLPYFNGYYWCGEIRKISNVPLIFLSSKAENMDIVMAMQMGGDDYITKPFDLNVVIAKIQALLRRTYDFSQVVDYLIWQDVYLYPSDTKLVYCTETVDLTRTELQIMEILFQAKGQFVKRDKIIEKCWEGDSFIDNNTLAVNMTRLRKKLNEVGLDQLILTKKGIGYGLNQTVASDG